jgi:phosphate transport system substrate-binding protein
VARDGVAVIVNPANPVSDLSMIQIGHVFGGEAKTWKEVGGGEGDIVVIDRDKKSNLRKSLEDLVLGGEEFAATARTVGSAAEMLDAVRSTATAIGYLPLHKMATGVRALRVDGVEMSRLTMVSGRYPLARSFFLAVHMKVSPLTERFIEFALSPQGQALFVSGGLIDVF